MTLPGTGERVEWIPAVCLYVARMAHLVAVNAANNDARIAGDNVGRAIGESAGWVFEAL